MGLQDKKDEVVGTAKEKIGRATDNDRLEAEGAVQHTKGKLGEAADKVKDKIEEALD